MEDTFLKVDRRGKLLRRLLIVDPNRRVLRYCRQWKKFTFKRVSEYLLTDIKDVRKDWKSQKFTKVQEKERGRWLLGKMTRDNRIREECSFSILFNDQRSLDLIANDSSKRDLWVNQLKCCMFEAKYRQRTSAIRSYLQKCFTEADSDCDRCINFTQALSILNKLNIIINKGLAEEVYKKSKIVTKVREGEHVIDFDEFFEFFQHLLHRSDIESVFKIYAKDRDIIGPEELQRFFFSEQYMSYDLCDCEKLIEKYQSSWLSGNMLKNSSSSEDIEILEKYMNVKGFESMLLSEDFDLFDRNKLDLYQDMKRPLNHYYIKSSHNTYLLAGQLVGDSSIEGYVEALRRGYRCIELDIWDGDEEDGPIVYHGYTMVSKLLLRNVLDAISDHAFDASPYPLILSLDVNCSEDQQKTAAALLVAILGDKLYKRPAFPDERELPTPEQLKGKILVKAKCRNFDQSRLSLSSSSSSSSSLDESMNETRRFISKRRYSVQAPIAANHLTRRMTKPSLVSSLEDLAIYCKARKFHSLKDTITWRFNEMFSMNEVESARLAQFETEDYIKCTAKHLCRIYPKGSRIDSSNYDPIIHWSVGCQMVALNVQTPGKYLMMNESKFKENGGCGYVLKSEMLTKLNSIESKERKGFRLKTLELTMISGVCIPKNGKEVAVDPYVKIKVYGHQEDRRKFKTSVVRNNGFNPNWSQTFVINVKYPELAFLFFSIKDECKSGKNNTLASNVVPVTAVGQGYRHLKMVNARGEQIDDCLLFLKTTLYHS